MGTLILFPRELKLAQGKIEEHYSEFFQNDFSSFNPRSRERSQETVRKVSEEIQVGCGPSSLVPSPDIE